MIDSTQVNGVDEFIKQLEYNEIMSWPLATPGNLRKLLLLWNFIGKCDNGLQKRIQAYVSH